MRAEDCRADAGSAAAQAAAKAFIVKQPAAPRFGLVAFLRHGGPWAGADAERDALVRAIEALQRRRRHRDRRRDSRLAPGLRRDRARYRRRLAADWKRPAQPPERAPGAIILLTDGSNTTGPDALDAAASRRPGRAGAHRRLRHAGRQRGLRDGVWMSVAMMRGSAGDRPGDRRRVPARGERGRGSAASTSGSRDHW